jgi:NADPH-dependent 2,4-dienoyl-CoA reductase/sulfur reductase-like enzyme/rhodanese-related sulfurtransferase
VEKADVFSYAACGLPYALAGDIAEADALRKTGDGVVRDVDYFYNVKGIDVLSGWHAEEIDTTEQKLLISRKGERRELEWDELVFATGARPLKLPNQPDHPRVRSFHTFHDVHPLHQGLAKGEIASVIIIGAGLVGCELAEAFGALWGADVTLIEAAETPLPGVLGPETAGIVSQALRDNDVRLHMGAPVERVEARDDGVTVTAGGRSFKADIAVVAIGVVPVTELARQAGVELGPNGAIAVDDRLQTSRPHIWAIGDCIEVRHSVTGKPCFLPLGSLANRQGRTLANVLVGRDDRFPPIVGAVAVKVFDSNIAAVGLTHRSAEEHFQDVRSVCLSAQDRPHYWPEAKDIALQLIYDSGSSRVLGVQAVGEGDVTKRVDVATQLIKKGAVLEEFSHLEHAYAPPYSPAIDPLGVAAFAAQNFEDGVLAISPEDSLDDVKVLDVRHPEEREARPFPAGNTTEVPLSEIRDRLKELEDGPWVVVCERGTRSSETVRLLEAEGIQAQYLGGGVKWLILSGRATAKT